MSFQDIGRKGPPHSSSSSSSSRPQQSPISPTAKFRNNGGPSSVSSTSAAAASAAASSGGTAIVQPMSMGMDGDHEYSAISQAILQYQQNVGILSNIIQSIGSSNTAQDTQVLTQQYNLQTDVIQQLSSKIQLQLEQMNMNHGHNNSHSHNHSHNHGTLQQHRATHLKLTRDYKWVETKYKNVQLDARRRWNMVQMEKKRIVEEEQRKTLENDLDHDNQQLQMQLRDDRIVEEIMREREEEVRNINKGMHQVNEIYKDLANIVSFQQDQVDEVETTMEEANKNAESGLKQIEKAHAKSEEGNCVIS